MADDADVQTLQADDGTTWVEITSISNSDEAELIKGFLEAEDIPAQIEHADASILPANLGKLGDVRIYVPADDKERALQLLKQRETDYEKLDDDEETLVTDDGEADIDENAPPEPETEPE